MEQKEQSSQAINLLDNTSKDYADITQSLQKNNQDISQTFNLNDTYTKSSILRTSIDSSLLHIKKHAFNRATSPKLSHLKMPKFYQWLFLSEEKKKKMEIEEKKEKEVKEENEKSFID